MFIFILKPQLTKLDLLLLASPRQNRTTTLDCLYFFLSLVCLSLLEEQFKTIWHLLIAARVQQRVVYMASGVRFLPLCCLSIGISMCLSASVLLQFTSKPHLAFFFSFFSFLLLAQRARQGLAKTAGCRGNTLCHRNGLEQELAYPCQSAGRIWAMPCVNRWSDFHSDDSGISPTLLLSGKATPASLFLKAPRVLLSSPISCLNYAPLCAVVFFLPLLPTHLLLLRWLPSSSWSLIFFLLTVCLSLCIVKRWRPRFWSLKRTVFLLPPLPQPNPPPSTPTTRLSFSLLSSLHLKENTAFSMHKRLDAVNRRKPPGPMENIVRAAATVSLKGEREQEEEEGARLSEWGRQLEGITVQFHRQHNYKHLQC